MRLDLYIFKKFNLKSRSYAAQLIKSGYVKVDNIVMLSPSNEVDDKNFIEIIAAQDFASFGGYKLKKALDEFNIDLNNLTAADIGCSNGGFCDLMLRRGILSILAVDVGECALSDEVKNNSKVTFLKANARFSELFENEIVDFVSADVSFISLELILPTVFKILKKNGRAVVLVKPQFELNKNALNKQGIVKSEKDRAFAVEKIKSCAMQLGFETLGLTESPKSDESKNTEYLLYLKKNNFNQTKCFCTND